MSDLDNDRDQVVERPRETVIVHDRPKKSVWRWLLPLLILLALIVGLYIVFSPENEEAMMEMAENDIQLYKVAVKVTRIKEEKIQIAAEQL